jgi:hypothetical protein
MKRSRKGDMLENTRRDKHLEKEKNKKFRNGTVRKRTSKNG